MGLYIVLPSELPPAAGLPGVATKTCTTESQHFHQITTMHSAFWNRMQLRTESKRRRLENFLLTQEYIFLNDPFHLRLTGYRLLKLAIC